MTVYDLYYYSKQYYAQNANKNNIYHADYEHAPDVETENAYRELARMYKYKTCPIFAGGLGKNVDFYGIKTNHKNAVMIEMDVPDNMLVQQNYYNWINFLAYFKKIGISNAIDNNQVSELARKLHRIKNRYDVTQIVLPYIDLNWVTMICNPVPEKFIEMHMLSDETNILKISEYYETKVYKKTNIVNK